MSNESLRRRVNFRDYVYKDWPGRQAETTIDLVLDREESTPLWLSEITELVPHLRLVARDVYIRWAITINAMHVAETHYDNSQDKGLVIRTQRPDKNGRAINIALESWHASDAAKNYRRATPALAAYALVDLYGLVEEIVFEFYRIFLNGNPLLLLKGEEFRAIRRLYHDRNKSTSDLKRWNTAWAHRLDSWQRKRLYDGLSAVFIAFYTSAEFKTPSIYTKTTVKDWANVIEAVGEARNLVTHGVGIVSKRLEELSKGLTTNAFNFKEGDKLDIDINHLMFFEGYIHNLLSAIGISAFEKKHGKIAGMI